MSYIPNNNLISPRTDAKKRSTGSLAARSKVVGTLNSGRRALSIPPSKCSLCDKKKMRHDGSLINITHKTLYTKYASSQNYYYTKDINELLADSRTPIVISYKDVQTLDESEEYLKRLYKSSEYNGKIKLLAEYYKFHWDIPRLFMLPTTEVINRYHDRKRRLQYLKVTKMLKDQKDTKNPHPKGHEEVKPKTEEIKPMSIADKLLVGLETSHSIIKQEEIRRQEEKGNKTSRGQGGESQRARGAMRGQDIREQRQRKDEDAEKRKDASTFNTLQDLNVKLGEIISNSDFKLSDTNYFGRNDQSLNESIGNLKNFLNYLQLNPNGSNPTQQPIPEILKISQQIQQKPTAPAEPPTHHTRKSVVIKSITPRPEKPSDDDVQQQGLRSTRAAVMTWSRADSTPMITPSPSELARRGSGGMKETMKGEEKIKEENNVGGSGQTSLSSTMTSKSKSVYSSVTKIRNFEEAVKISQQNSQLKLVSPVETGNAKHLNKPIMLRVSSTGTQETNQREASPSTEFIYKGNMDSSIKTPFGVSDDKSKESNKDISPISKQGSQLLLSPSVSKGNSNNKQTNSKNFYPTRTLEGFMQKPNEMISPQAQSPNFRIKSHREVGTSFDRNPKDINVQPASAKQVPQIQLAMAKTHTRFGSGSLASPDGRSSGLKLDTPGREFKNLMSLGVQESQLKDSKAMPNSASRREALLGKGEFKGENGNFVIKESGGSATDREREAPPLSPKVSTQRGKISHKHTRSEGGKMFELPMGSMNDQRIKELLKLNDIDAYSDCSQRLKKGEQVAMKKGGYNTSNMANFVLSSNRELNYESTQHVTQKKHVANKASMDMQIGGNSGGLISNRTAKADVIVRKKSALKKEDGKQKNLGLVLDRFEETKLAKANKALSVKGSGNFTPNNFSKSSLQKTKGKQDLF